MIRTEAGLTVVRFCELAGIPKEHLVPAPGQVVERRGAREGSLAGS